MFPLKHPDAVVSGETAMSGFPSSAHSRRAEVLTLADAQEMQRSFYDAELAGRRRAGDQGRLVRRNGQAWLWRLRARLAVHYAAGGALLDMACGDGTVCWLAASRLSRAVGVDISSECVAYAREHRTAANVEYLVSPIEAYRPPPGQFDVVTLYEVLEHLHDPSVALERARLALKPGGHLIASTPNASALLARIIENPRYTHLRGALGRPRWEMRHDHVEEYGYTQLRELITAAGFTVERSIGLSLALALPGLFHLRRIYELEVLDNVSGWLFPGQAQTVVVVARA